jgi:hypothetical protein
MKNVFLEILTFSIAANYISHWHNTIQWIKRKTGLDRFLEKIFRYPITDCSKCVGFWLTLGITWDIYLAVIVSFVAYLVEHIIDRTQSWYE